MRNRGRLIVSIAGRITVFLYIFSVFIFLLYIQGSFQDFLDATLIRLLFFFRYSSLIFLAFAVSYIFIMLIAGRNTGRKIITRIILTVCGIIFISAIFILVEIVITGLEPVT